MAHGNLWSVNKSNIFTIQKLHEKYNAPKNILQSIKKIENWFKYQDENADL